MKRPTGFVAVGIFASILLVLLSLTLGVSANDNTFTLISGCTCPGYSVTFICSIQGGGNTIWKGSSFDCPSSSDSNNNQILLLHSRFGTEDRNPTGTCNGGDIQGQGVSKEDGRFTSQLNVTITPSVVDRQVQCVYDNTSAEILVGTGVITVTTADDLMTPSNVSLIAASHNRLTFNWTAVTHSCSAVNYTLNTSSGCGDCPTTTSDPSATCSIETIQPNKVVRLCTASVQAVVCGNIQGGQSETSKFQLSVPDAPQNVTIIPSYAQGNKTLLSLTVNFNAVTLSGPISKYVTGYPENYTIVFTNSTSDDVCNTTSLTACPNQMCSSMFYVSSSPCSPHADIDVTVFATSVLGNGASSNEITVDGMNSFVDISDLVDRGAATMIFCTFSNIEEGSDLSCSIVYSKCEHLEISSLQQRSNSTGRDGNTLQIDLNFDLSGGGLYCYTATAIIGSRTLKVVGTFSRGIRSIGAGAITGIVIAVVVILLAVLFAIAVIIVLRRKAQSMKKHQIEINDEALKGNFEDGEEVDSERFQIIPVQRNCEVKWLMKNCKLFYKPGCVYYQFTRQTEVIKKDKDIIFQKKDASRTLFWTKDGRSFLLSKAPDSNEIRNPSFSMYHVFVQSKGSGNRPLFKGTSILYDREITKVEEVDVSISPKDRMDPKRREKFRILRVPRDCSLIDFIREQPGLQFRPGCAFFEFTHHWEDIGDEKEVILMDENNNFYTGDVARQMIKAPGSDIPRPHFSEWTVFVQSKHYGSRHLPAESTLLYEVKSDEEEFKSISSTGRIINKIRIGQGCQLRDLVEDHKDLEYSDGSAKFYFEFNSNAEFISEEKEILLMNKDEQLFTGDKVKKFIGAPTDCGHRVNNPQLKGYRIFISNAGSGTRYLKPHSYLLWEATGTKL